MKDRLEIENYSILSFCYDLILEINGYYPTNLADDEEDEEVVINETVVLKIIVAQHNLNGDYFNRKGFPIKEFPNKYSNLLKKYFVPNSKYIILDISVSKIPIKIAMEEGDVSGDFGEMEVNANTYYSATIVDKYVLKKSNLYQIYLYDVFPPECAMGWEYYNDFYDYFFNFIYSKSLILQPTIYKPTFELSRLHIPIDLIKDADYICDNLNCIKEDLGGGGDAFSQFLIDSFNSVKKIILKDKILSECVHCGNLSDYNKLKQYCTSACRKRAESKRYYKKNRKRLLAVKRKDMQETREIYRIKGVGKPSLKR